MTRPAFSVLTIALALVFLALGLREGVRQYREDSFVRAGAREALSEATGADEISKVTAIRDFIRRRVRNVGFSALNRPFLRNTAAETLESGKGRCGEATRLFINMASAAGISAHRVYLEGKKPHVVAVVVAEDGSKLLVDSADRPYLDEIEPISRIQQSGMFDSYSTLGWRRLRLLRALPSHDVNLGPLNYFFENPHAIGALFWLLPSAVLFGLTAFSRSTATRNRTDAEPELSLIGGLSEDAGV